ncbi:Hamartin protein-domain-containing protein [Elsinoe ampelina]|uniref:Hamartin protein-domain-containing protein n=1 Tax=Elsinoe ampelina TaxID=302913 RepID=A0A6A6GMC8_9PEZI|nr:Hamartin protein-domain-containing protein [Elsinoe ampelina]
MSGSSSDTVSLLSKAFVQPEINHDTLTSLRKSLELFADKHQDPEETQSAKVQEELRKIYIEHVQTDTTKLEAFVVSLTAVEPYLRRTGDLQSWFDITISTIVDVQGNKKSLVQQTQDFILTCTTFDKDATDAKARSQTCKTSAAKIINEYLKRTDELAKGNTSSSLRLQNRSQQQLEAILIELGKRHPQELFGALEGPLLRPSTRYHTLQLLCAWLRHQHAHLDLVTHTQIVDILLKCLMNDRSTGMVSSALQCLLMLLPHIPATVSSQLPRLFLIYSRCLCWEKFSDTTSKAQRDLVTDDRLVNGSDDEVEELFTIDPGWDVVRSVPDAPDSAAPELLTYFTYLYGLYPVNFMSYVRKPRKYLKQINFPGAEHFDLDQNVIRKRTEQFQRAHLLHPSFFTTTPEEELADTRWLKAEPSEVVAECLGLYSGNAAIPQSPGPAPTSKLPPLPESPTVTTKLAPLSPDRLMSPTHDADPPSPSPSIMAGSIDSLSKSVPVLSADAAFLQKELLVMRNELNFERYLKQQHVAAIGQLKRERIKAVTVEAETTSLYNANKRLQRKLEEANKFNEKILQETQSRKTHARQSEDLLNAKVRSLRSSLADQKILQASLTKATADIEILRELLAGSESREARLQNKLEAQMEQLKEIEALKAEIAKSKSDTPMRGSDDIANSERPESDQSDTKTTPVSSGISQDERDMSVEAKDAQLEDPLFAEYGATAWKETHKHATTYQAEITTLQNGWNETKQDLQQLKAKYNDLLATTASTRTEADGPLRPYPAPAPAADGNAQLFQGPAVGATYGLTDGIARTLPRPVNGHGSPVRPPRPDEFGARSMSDHSMLSRSEGSANQGGGLYGDTSSSNGVVTGSYDGKPFLGDNYGPVGGGIGNDGRPRESSSAFSSAREESNFDGRDRFTAMDKVRRFGRGEFKGALRTSLS